MIHRDKQKTRKKQEKNDSQILEKTLYSFNGSIHYMICNNQAKPKPISTVPSEEKIHKAAQVIVASSVTESGIHVVLILNEGEYFNYIHYMYYIMYCNMTMSQKFHNLGTVH